jgi:hypothetical protein
LATIAQPNQETRRFFLMEYIALALGLDQGEGDDIGGDLWSHQAGAERRSAAI